MRRDSNVAVQEAFGEAAQRAPLPDAKQVERWGSSDQLGMVTQFALALSS